MTLTAALLGLGLVLVAMALGEDQVRRQPLSSALVYLSIGWAVAAFGPPGAGVDLERHAELLLLLAEWAVLVSLFAVGLRLRVPPTLRGWRVAVVLASAGMAVSVALTALAAHLLLALAWPAALLLGAILAPTDPVLASEVKIRSQHDADSVRLALTAEGALNDGTAFPAVMLALGLLGLHPLGSFGIEWLVSDLLWAVAAGLAIGWIGGHLLGAALRWQMRRGHVLRYDELLFLGTIALAYGAARASHTTAFLVVFAAGATLIHRSVQVRASSSNAADSEALLARLMGFGERLERLVEVLMVLLIGAAMHSVQWRWQMVGFALALICIVRPLMVLAVVRTRSLPATQRRLIAWFGIRGVGSLFYLLYALNAGVDAALARELVSACLVCIAASIVLHGVSATPLMGWYQGRRKN